ncbi:insecticidal delta-endotoxin Cry8Ea1 family protein [Bacillus cereus]|uniref:insecticidal delta-endotoxin Cry8Ea1 family protein n=1 Tax=Bacillus cereus TaxID=1396 RepID=UPI0034D76948
MTNPTILYPSYHNVLAHPIRLDSFFDPFVETFKDLKGAWEEFGKTGYMDPLKQHLQIAWDTSQNGTVDYLALTKASISLIGLIPGADAVVPFINMFVDFIFPKLFGRGSQQNAQAQFFELIIEKVKELVDEDFRNFTLNNLLNYLDGMQTALSHFQNDVQIAICQGEQPGLMLDQTPTACTPTTDHLISVRESFKDARTTIETALPHFKNPMLSTNDNTPDFNSDTVLLTLPMYTTAATLNLILHQGYIQFAERWKSVNYDESFINQTKADLQHRIQDYSTTVSTTFEKFKPTLNPSNKESVNKYNRYVRSMTLQSLDIAATWPTLDNVNYPSNVDIQLDQTRLVFSDVAGPWEGNDNITSNIIDVLTPINTGIGFQESSDLRKFTYPRIELQSMQFHGQYVNSKSVEHCYSDGLKLNYKNKTITAGVSNIDESNQNNKHNYGPVINSPITDINVNSQNSQYLDLNSVMVNGGQKVAGCSPLSSNGNSNNAALPNQKINVIYSVQSNDKPEKHADTYRKWGYMSSHIPYDLVPENVIGDIDPDTKQPSLLLKGFPAEKGYGDSIAYVSEPLNGANAVKLTSYQVLKMEVTNQTTQKYRIRIRYATGGDTAASIWFHIIGPSGNDLTNEGHNFSSVSSGNKMFVQGNNGKYVLNILTDSIELPSGQQTILIQNTNSQDLFLDRIEFISLPSTSTPTSTNFVEPESLEKIINQVNQLFSSSSQTELAHTVSDYKIDQVVLKVNALSDDVFGVEKKALRKLVNQAKQLSKARNVLVGGNFEKGHEWALSREATMVANHELFKGDHLLLPPPTLYPSYAYQKIDESKLKSNTRYTVSGFIAQSEHLEVVVSRYGKEVHDMLDIPYEEALPISSDESPNCCKPAACQCSSCDGSQSDSHFFSYSIDVGSLQSDVNLGIEFGLRIAKPNGFAKISNLEIKEDRPLTEKEIKKVQRKEQKWKKAFNQEQAEVATTLQPTLDQINALYQNEDWNGSVHPHVTYQHLSAVVVPTLPKQRHWFMEDREGEHVVLTQQFQQALDRAFQQIEEQNLIHNGNFANGLTDWTVTGDAQLTIFDEDPVLELAHWDASISQTIEIMDFEEDTEYKLRVRGKGKGTVTVQHGEEELETMTFNTTSFTTQEQTFYFEGDTVDVHVQSENNTFLIDSVELIEIIEE